MLVFSATDLNRLTRAYFWRRVYEFLQARLPDPFRQHLQDFPTVSALWHEHDHGLHLSEHDLAVRLCFVWLASVEAGTRELLGRLEVGSHSSHDMTFAMKCYMVEMGVFGFGAFDGIHADGERDGLE